MEPEVSLPYTQEPFPCPYPEPDQSSPWAASHFLNIHFNIILPFTSGSYRFSLSLGFPHQKPRMLLSSSRTCYVSRPSHSSWVDHSHNIWWAIQRINQGFELYFCVFYFWGLKKRYESSGTIFYLMLSYINSFNVFLPFLSTCRFTVPNLIKM